MNWVFRNRRIVMARILVVDDEQDGSEAVCKFLSRAGHDATCMPSGRKALAALTATNPDVLVLDLLMPEMNGAEFLDLLRNYSRGAALPIIVLTAITDGPLLKQIKQMGVSQVLHKTASSLSDLLECIQGLVPPLPASGLLSPDAGTKACHLQ
jgi:CheY-like chemotaxis protein